ncbi:MAG: carbohydrate binding domain-containing protein [Acidobacteria bacterium]|nr:carbohydrate binding domain-containing protein [Acidobacteriota bacterium]
MRQSLIVSFFLALTAVLSAASAPPGATADPLFTSWSPVDSAPAPLPELVPPAVRHLAAKHAGVMDAATVTSLRPLFAPDGTRVEFYEAVYADDAGACKGYAVISATERNTPVPAFSEREPLSARFDRRVSVPYRIVWYGPGYAAAEDLSGKLLAEIGDRPGRRVGPVRPGTAAEPLDYEEIKSRARAEGIVLSARARTIRAEWDALREHLRNGAPAPSTDALQTTWIYEAIGRDGTNRFRQIPPDTHPNDRDFYSGCGPTAWVNLLAWWDLNGWANVLPNLWMDSEGHSVTSPDDYIGHLSMDLSYQVGTWNPPTTDVGSTWPDRMPDALDYIEDTLNYDVVMDHRIDIDLFCENDEETQEILGLIRDGIQAHRKPVIIAYFPGGSFDIANSHYDIGYKLKDHNGSYGFHSWVYTDPHGYISRNNVIAVYTPYALERDDNWLPNGGFEELDLSDWSMWANNPCFAEGWSTFGGPDVAEIRTSQAADEGLNCVRLWKSADGNVGVYRDFFLFPGNYEISARVYATDTGTLGKLSLSSGSFSRTQCYNVTTATAFNQTQVMRLVVPSTLPDASDLPWMQGYKKVRLQAGHYNVGPFVVPNYFIDNVRVTLVAGPMVDDPGFEQQLTSTLTVPWHFQGNGRHAGSIVNSSSTAVSGLKCARIVSTPGDAQWTVGDVWQEVKVKPNTNYRVGAWVKTSAAYYVGAVRVMSPGTDYAFASTAFGGSSAWKYVTVDFNSGNRSAVKISVANQGSPSSASNTLFIDNVSISQR